MVVTIDGPAGSGKSTVAATVARRRGWMFLDTGATYRAVAWQADQLGIDPKDADGLAAMCGELNLELEWSNGNLKVLVDGEDITNAIREERISASASAIATVPQVREALVAKQRELVARYANVITEGRDQGSVVFPDADLKVFLDASVQERARRRHRELCDRGDMADYREILVNIRGRDDQDQSRATAPLVVPEGAVRLDTTDLSPEQVVTAVLDMIDEAGGG